MALAALFMALLAALPTTRSEQIFSNRGTLFKEGGELDGWTAGPRGHRRFFNEPPALVMGQVFDPDYSGRYHSEVRIARGYRLGDTLFYGFAFRLHPDWNFNPPISYNTAQFISQFSDCDAWMPSNMVWLRGTQLFTRAKYGSVCDQTTNIFPLDTEVSAGQWHKIVLGTSWQSNATGFLQVWFHGKLVLDKQNIATTVLETEEFQFRIGLYGNGWHDDKTRQPSPGTYEVFYKIAIAMTKDEADPELW